MNYVGTADDVKAFHVGVRALTTEALLGGLRKVDKPITVLQFSRTLPLGGDEKSPGRNYSLREIVIPDQRSHSPDGCKELVFSGS